MDHVFAYGSLAADAHPAEQAVLLPGHRRRWGVAMDNAAVVPGYKCYVDPDGARPPLHVAFLDVAPGDGAVNGVLRPVDAAELAALDARERNYVRVDAGDRFSHVPGRVWMYVGSPAGRARLAAGLRHGTAVVATSYLDAVLRGFARLGAAELARFHASSDLDGLPIAPLLRVDVVA